MNAADYTREQLAVWAPPIEQMDKKRWRDSLAAHDSLVAVVAQETEKGIDEELGAETGPEARTGTSEKSGEQMGPEAQAGTGEETRAKTKRETQAGISEETKTRAGVLEKLGTGIGEEKQGRKIIGFGDMDDTGYLDCLYVDKDWQGKGAATMLCDALEKRYKERMFHVKHSESSRGREVEAISASNEKKEAFHVKHFISHVSITARPFFERRGYQVLREQQVERGSVLLTNFVMQKAIGEENQH